MKREARDFRETAPKPVERIPVEIKRPGLRLLLVIAALAIASGAFFYGFRGLTSVEAGWTPVEADGASGMTAADDFQLLAELGAGQESALTERRRLVSVYSAAARDAYTLYTSAEYVAGVNNLWYINHHPGEEIVLDARLYRAVEKSLQSGSWLYLGPLYETWDSVYFSLEDREAAAADPRANPETADFLKQAAEMIRNGEIKLELRGDNRVCLTLSDRILAFGQEYGVSRWLDFGWQKNAFIADDLADALIAAGWSRAVLSSGDGFIRCLDGRGTFGLNLYADTETGIRQIAEMEYSGPASLLMLLPPPVAAEAIPTAIRTARCGPRGSRRKAVWMSARRTEWPPCRIRKAARICSAVF
jgi:hypothetical protein